MFGVSPSVDRAPGVLLTSIEGTVLTPDTRDILLHPATIGVILFAHNFTDWVQLVALIQQIRMLRSPALLVAVDHEGGGVQRFGHTSDGFTNLPPMAAVGACAEESMALHMAQDIGHVVAVELASCGIDLSLSPVLDLQYARSAVIGDRAWARHPLQVTKLASSFILGMNRYGMQAVGKHFPGHGYVAADSHTEYSVDERELAQLQEDILPYRLLSTMLGGVMMAHVCYQNVDESVPCVSPFWIQYLRQTVRFQGCIVTDDMMMTGVAAAGGDIVARSQRALHEGCDVLILCHHPRATVQLLEQLVLPPVQNREKAYACLTRHLVTVDRLDPVYQSSRKRVRYFVDHGTCLPVSI